MKFFQPNGIHGWKLCSSVFLTDLKPSPTSVTVNSYLFFKKISGHYPPNILKQLNLRVRNPVDHFQKHTDKQSLHLTVPTGVDLQSPRTPQIIPDAVRVQTAKGVAHLGHVTNAARLVDTVDGTFPGIGNLSESEYLKNLPFDVLPECGIVALQLVGILAQAVVLVD